MQVVRFLPRFENGEFRDALAAYMRTGLDLPVVDELFTCISTSGILFVFDWIAWKNALGVDPFDPSHIASADLETIRKVLTYAVRENRFSDGSLAARCSDGSMERAIRRLAELVATT
ncbi:MAG TPA: DUF6508 domain-containing protein [Thermoanaerobaculia bacterium]|jgi:hypothetical protein|nr:DUF6508 domain-containing protein [Thermoanaerobaculia bacterium]